jgi:branched-chain amino acid transport system permease protein
MAMKAYYEFKPLNVGRWLVWSLFALLLAVAPLCSPAAWRMTMLAQMGIAIIVCLSYNMLLGQGGMLSFGHAVYSGLGSFLAIHALNSWSARATCRSRWRWSPSPAAGRHVLRGAVRLRHHQEVGHHLRHDHAGHRRAGVRDVADVPGVLRRRGRRLGQPRAGQASGHHLRPADAGVLPDRRLHLLSVAAMFAFTRTPLGRMLNAVRDNPERVEFVGYDTQKVRYLAFIIAGFFAGISGGLAALNFEIVTAEVVGAGRSGAYLLFTFLGGATFFFGPIIGAVLMVLAFVLLSASSPRPGCCTWAWSSCSW